MSVSGLFGERGAHLCEFKPEGAIAQPIDPSALFDKALTLWRRWKALTPVSFWINRRASGFAANCPYSTQVFGPAAKAVFHQTTPVILKS